MTRFVRSTRVLLAAATVVLGACADTPTGPTADLPVRQFSLATIGGATLVFGANGIPTNCADVQAALPGAADGNYVVGPTSGPAAGQYFAVYCANVGGSFRDYLTLAALGAGQNYSSTASHTPFRSTSFSKIRLDPATLTVDIGDVTFSNTTSADTRPVAYGIASDCQGGFGSRQQSANINLTGTSFSVNDSFLISGWFSHGSVNGTQYSFSFGGAAWIPVTGQVVDLTGGGFCGGIGSTDFHNGIFLYAGSNPGYSLDLAFNGPSLNVVTFESACAAVQQFVSNKGIANSLCAKLNAAAASAARGNANAKANQLNAFKNVVAAQSGKALTAAQAAFLTSWANQL